MFFAPDPAMQCLLEPTPDELIGLDHSIAEIQQRDASGGSLQRHHVFQYAAALISHRRKEYLTEGVGLMEGLVFQVWRRREKSFETTASPITSVTTNAAEAKGGRAEERQQDSAPPIQGPSAADQPAEQLPQVGEEIKAMVPLEECTADMLPVYYYYIAIAWCKLGDLVKARSAVERMLLLEPQNHQGKHLRDHIERLQNRDGVVGLVGAVAALSAAVSCFYLLRKH
jgi:hypothetical protein